MASAQAVEEVEEVQHGTSLTDFFKTLSLTHPPPQDFFGRIRQNLVRAEEEKALFLEACTKAIIILFSTEIANAMRRGRQGVQIPTNTEQTILRCHGTDKGFIGEMSFSIESKQNYTTLFELGEVQIDFQRQMTRILEWFNNIPGLTANQYTTELDNTILYQFDFPSS